MNVITITITDYFPQRESDYSGKTGEAVEVTTADGMYDKAVLSLRELQDVIRFQHRQRQKRNDKPAAPVRPANPPTS